MTRCRNHTRLRTAASACALTALAVLALSGHGGSPTPARARVHARTAAEECEGDACAQVTLTFDEQRQQYRAQNNSADRWARVTASNMASSASVCLAPGKSDSLALKSVVGHYRAEYSETRCGVPPAE